MQQEIDNLLFEVDHAIESAEEIASGIADRPGAHCDDAMVVTIVKLKEAHFWLAEVQKVIIRYEKLGIH